MPTNHAPHTVEPVTHYTCQDCGHEWDSHDPAPCVYCGEPSDLLIAYPAREASEGDLVAPVCVACALDVVERTLDALAELQSRCKAIMQRQDRQDAPLDNPPGVPPGNSPHITPITPEPVAPGREARNRAQRRAEMHHRHKHTAPALRRNRGRP